MKIRNMEPGDATNWRQALGMAIRGQREARGKSVRDVARRAKVQVADVESWERGGTVPNSEQWKALCNGISRGMTLYTETWQKARHECDSERNIITRSISVHTNGTNGAKPLATKLGDKLAHIVAADKPPVKPGSLLPPIVSVPSPDARTVNPGHSVAYHNEPTPGATVSFAKRDTARSQLGLPDEFEPSGRRKMPPVPPGGKTTEAINGRIKYAKELLLARPNARTTGADSISEAVRHRFGIGLSPATINILRDEIRAAGSPKAAHERVANPTAMSELVAREVAAANAEADKRDAAPELYPAHDPAKPAPMIAGLAASVPTSDDDITAAVQLILDGIPNLQTFTIDVAESGEVSVDYQVREVKITTRTGSLKVSRK